jgi:hypothetical protein
MHCHVYFVIILQLITQIDYRGHLIRQVKNSHIIILQIFDPLVLVGFWKFSTPLF